MQEDYEPIKMPPKEVVELKCIRCAVLESKLASKVIEIAALRHKLTAARKECEEAKAEIERLNLAIRCNQDYENQVQGHLKLKIEKLEAVMVAAETVEKRCLKWGILPKGKTCHDIESWKGDNDLSCHGCRLSKALDAARSGGV